jgi:(p)ppGpp synthase/HD superfamily hydrolase
MTAHASDGGIPAVPHV